MEGATDLLCHGILQRARILHTLRGVQDLDPDNTAVLVIIEDAPSRTPEMHCLATSGLGLRAES
jgi:hypothetical protein